MIGPDGAKRHRRVAKQLPLVRRCRHAAIQAAPPPVFRPLDQPARSGLRSTYRSTASKCSSAAIGKRLEPALIDVSHAGRAMMGMPALRMRDGEPAKELGDLLRRLPAAARRRSANGCPSACSRESAAARARWASASTRLERGKVGLLAKQPQPAIGSIEHMVRITADDRPGTSWHAASLPNRTPPSRNDSRPLYFSRRAIRIPRDARASETGRPNPNWPEIEP